MARIQFLQPKKSGFATILGGVSDIIDQRNEAKNKEKEEAKKAEQEKQKAIRDAILRGYSSGRLQPRQGVDLSSGNFNIGDFVQSPQATRTSKITPTDLETIQALKANELGVEPKKQNILQKALSYISGREPEETYSSEDMARVQQASQPFFQQYMNQFVTGGQVSSLGDGNAMVGQDMVGQGGTGIEELIQAYYSTEDEEQAKQIENMLMQMGFQFQ